MKKQTFWDLSSTPFVTIEQLKNVDLNKCKGGEVPLVEIMKGMDVYGLNSNQFMELYMVTENIGPNKRGIDVLDAAINQHRVWKDYRLMTALIKESKSRRPETIHFVNKWLKYKTKIMI